MIVSFTLSYLHVSLCFMSITCGRVSVKVGGSTFIGKQLNTVYESKPYAAFWKIPYAEPPLRDLRFKSPKVKEYRNETFDHSSLPNDVCKCYDEDCLYLSIYMPINSSLNQNLPVLVWLDEKPQTHTPDFLIEEDVVVLSFSYRKSIFGFLNTGDDFAEGNMGAKDVVLALKWVQNYIRSFAGDVSKVTVAGRGNAATITASLLLSPIAQGLYNRVIALSGSALSPADYKHYNFDIMNKLYWKLKGPFEKINRTDLYQMLRNYSTCELIEASRDIFDSTEVRDSQRLINSFAPSIENSKNAFINKSPLDIYERRLTNNNAEVIIGYTSLEALHKLKGFVEDSKLLKYLNFNFQYIMPFEGAKDEYGGKRYRKIRQKIMDFYFINGTIGERSLRRYSKYVSDQVIYPLVRQARIQADVSCTNVYLYRFSFKGSLNVGWDSSVQNLNWPGATFGDEICYLFRCKSVNDVYKSAEASKERHFIRKFARLLANFVKYGNPTPHKADSALGDLIWDPFVPGKSTRALNLNRTPKMIDVPEETRLKFWDELKSEFFPDQVYKGEL